MLKYLNLLLVPMLLTGFSFDESSIQGQVGYRRDQLHIGATDYNATLEFNRINVIEGGLIARVTTDTNVYVEAEGNYGGILNHHSTKGHAYDASIAFGYPFYTCYFNAIPLVGYAIQEDSLRMHNFGQEEGQRIKGRTWQRWTGAWIGLQLDQTFGDWEVLLRGEYHFAKVDGLYSTRIPTKRTLRNSFDQNDASGVKAKLGVKYLLTNCVKVGVDATYARFSAHDASAHLTVPTEVNGKTVYERFRDHTHTSLTSYGIRGVVEYTF